MTTFNQFKKAFDNEVKSEIKWDYCAGFFCILIGITLTGLIEFDAIKYSGTKTFHYTGFSLIIIMGLTVLYWIKIRYRISAFDKGCSKEQIEKGITAIIEKYSMYIIKSQGTSYTFLYKPGSLTPWATVNFFFDADKIYINVRLVSKGNVDFGFCKRLEKKLVTEIKTSR
jgi:hypothetical protein